MSEYEGWAILELMGHRQRPGYVKEVEIAGAKMLRIDIPVGKDEAGQDRMITEFYGPSAVYALRPCSEDVLRSELSRYGADPRPVRPLEYREREALPNVSVDPDDDDERPF
jgi:hypothetical protein